MPEIRPLFRTLSVSASGLSAQRARMEIVARNIANAETTRTEQGGPYQRQIVELRAGRAAAPPDFGTHIERELLRRTSERHFAEGLPLGMDLEGRGVDVLGIVEDTTPGPLVYDPGHPDANAEGYVRMPNVDLNTEMGDLMLARRFYEANATAFEASKAMLKRSLEI